MFHVVVITLVLIILQAAFSVICKDFSISSVFMIKIPNGRAVAMPQMDLFVPILLNIYLSTFPPPRIIVQSTFLGRQVCLWLHS